MGTVEVSRDDGTYTAVHVETGVSGSGETEAMALAVLAEHLADRNEARDALSEEFAKKVERRRREYERGEYSSLDEVRDRLNS